MTRTSTGANSVPESGRRSLSAKNAQDLRLWQHEDELLQALTACCATTPRHSATDGFRDHPAVIERLALQTEAWLNSFTDWATGLSDDIWSTGVPLWQHDAKALAEIRSNYQ